MPSSAACSFSDHEVEIWPFSLWPNGGVELDMKAMALRQWPLFDRLAMREELRDRLERIPGVSIPAERLDKLPTFPTSTLGVHRSAGRRGRSMTAIYVIGAEPVKSSPEPAVGFRVRP
jgi:hypothetical protein